MLGSTGSLKTLVVSLLIASTLLSTINAADDAAKAEFKAALADAVVRLTVDKYPNKVLKVTQEALVISI